MLLCSLGPNKLSAHKVDKDCAVLGGSVMRDLRHWLDTVDKMGELKKLTGASWDLEIGAIKLLKV